MSSSLSSMSLQCWQILRWSWIPHILFESWVKERKAPYIPVELLQYIFSYLPLPSQVCLALSSKGLYALFSSVLRAKELRFPLMPRNGKTYAISEECHLRMTLLTQLEDSRWACCAPCQKLHPRREFPRYELKESHPWERSCVNSAGIIDLCPCIALTLRDRTRIVEHLKREKTAKNRTLNHIRKGLLSLKDDDGELYLLHRCTAYSKFRIEIRLSLTDSGQLVSHARYETHLSVLNLRMDSVRVCCNGTLAECFDSPTSAHNCDVCRARMVDLTRHKPASALTAAQVTRYLGRDEWFANQGWFEFEKQWYRQCRDSTDYIPI